MELVEAHVEPVEKLTELKLKSLLKQHRSGEIRVPDGTVPGLSIRIHPKGTVNFSLALRVAGEGGVDQHGKKIRGRKHRISLGHWPEVSIQNARGQANIILDGAKRGINPKAVRKEAATAGGLTIEQLSKKFMEEHVLSRELDSAEKYRGAFDVHINPHVGTELADVLTREQARAVMDKARVKRPRRAGVRGAPIGGVEAARTAIGVMHHMYAWALIEKKVRRSDNPCTLLTTNLPAKKKGEVILTLPEARIVWRAAALCGYPFGTQTQLQLLTSLRLGNWASAKTEWIDMVEAMSVIPADSYKSDHVHILPLVPPAIDILERIPAPTTGSYVLSSTGGSKPIVGVAKFYKTRLYDAIIAINGEPIPKRITTQTIRRTVASGIADILGFEGEKLVKRVLGHADTSVTAIYNQYGYVREMRRALDQWADKLTSPEPVRADVHDSKSPRFTRAARTIGGLYNAA